MDTLWDELISWQAEWDGWYYIVVDAIDDATWGRGSFNLEVSISDKRDNQCEPATGSQNCKVFAEQGMDWRNASIEDPMESMPATLLDGMVHDSGGYRSQGNPFQNHQGA